MSKLRSALSRYLSMRKGFGYKYEHQTRRLTNFVAFMEKRKARIITTKLAMEWATLPPERHASWALRLSDVRGFARHVASLDPRTEVPPVGILPGWKRAKPYVYSDAEIAALLKAALALPPKNGLRRWTYHTLFGLIVVTGMRISEAMSLGRDDVDLDAGVLTVRLTKFGSRGSFHCTRRPARRSATTPTGVMPILDYIPARPSSSPNRGAGCCTSTSIGSSGGYPERSAYGGPATILGRACTISGIASPSGRCSPGIVRARSSSSSFRYSPPTWDTPACAIPIGTSRPAQS